MARGYGREGKAIERVDTEGDPARFGDEPVLLAKRSGLPVFVGADRYRAGLLAQELSATERVVYLLDDGFQHRQLARDLDIVLLTLRDVEDALLPAGNLREPLMRLGEADVIVVREEERDALEKFLAESKPAGEHAIGSHPPRPQVWVIRRRLDLGDAARLPERPLVFCGIARSDSFTAMLAEVGARPVKVVAFRDPHSYAQRDISRLVHVARTLGADGFVTTEKDGVKLTPEMRRQLGAIGQISVPRLVVDLLEEKSVMEQIIRKVSQMNRRRRIVSE